MKLQFLGAARTVTGSCHLLEVGRTRILLDCGLYQGRRKESFEQNRRFEFEPSGIDAVVLSHAHIDHAGNLPRLVAAGFRGPIHATSATVDLCGWMLRDSAQIQEKDVEHVNKLRRREGKRPFEPLYTRRDADTAIRQLRVLAYDEDKELAPGVMLRFRDAGHILGSASCHLAIDEGGRRRTLVFTGDVGRKETAILRDPVPPERADILICESTYGGRLHAAEGDVRSRLRNLTKATCERGGKLLIPAFSVGRTQAIVYHLNSLFNAGELSPLPVFVDSPLSANVTDVFREHPECYDKETVDLLGRGDADPFGFQRLTYVRDVEASKALNDLRVPCVIISASGMCESGRVIHHLKRIAPDPRSTILLAGFMAEHTLGRRIAERSPFVKLYGEEYPLKAKVESICGLSGHADRDELLEYLGRLERPPERTFLVHGEEDQAVALARSLGERGFRRVDVPAPRDQVEL